MRPEVSSQFSELQQDCAKMIGVGLAEVRVTRAPNVLTSQALGSCVAVLMFDKRAGIGGLAHIMLPDSTRIRHDGNKAKFADTALDLLLEKMVDRGAMKERITAKVIGGASMFRTSDPLLTDIGLRNTLAVRDRLKELKIKIVAEDTGGDYGRSVELWVATGKAVVRSMVKGTKEI